MTGMLVARADDESVGEDDINYLYGMLSVLGAVLAFGTFAVPLRTRAMESVDVHPIVLQCYFSSAVYLTSFLIIPFVTIEFSWWGWLGAGLWVSSNLLAFAAIRQVGIAIAQATWSGATIIISFLWGATVFNEAIDNLGLALFGIFLLCIGIFGVSCSSLELAVDLPPMLHFLYILPIFRSKEDWDSLTDGEDWSASDPILINDVDGETTVDKYKYKKAKTPKRTTLHWILGVSLCLFMGFPNGSMMVPTKIDGVPEGVLYLTSFSIGALAVTMVYALMLITGHLIYYRKFVPFYPRQAMIPALLAGVLWSIGNFFSIYATKYLGLTIGFPLTQTALLVAGLWGLLYYKEISKFGARVMFFISAGIIIAGSILLSLYG